MSIENSEFPIAKESRRKRKESNKDRVVTYQTILSPHEPDKKEIQKKHHQEERKAMKRSI